MEKIKMLSYPYKNSIIGIPDVKVFKCQSCGEEFLDPETQHMIDEYIKSLGGE